MLSDGEQTIVAGGVAHWVRVEGSVHGGHPIVLVHGGPGGNAFWYERSIGPRLAQTATVVYYDQRGCGRSDRPADLSTYTMAHLVADLDEIRSALGVERIVPWAVSFGCLVAAHYAVAYPDRVHRLILQAPPIVGPLHPGAWSVRPAAVDAVLSHATRVELRAALAIVDDPIERIWLAMATLNGDSDATVKFLFHDHERLGASWQARPSSGLPFNEEMARALVEQQRVSLVDDLAALDIRTLLMAGLWDRHVGVDMVRDLATRLTDSRFHLFTRSGHLPEEEEPDEYAAVVRDFLLP